MRVTLAKRRSRSQKVGRLGELIFAEWATKHGLSATKVDDDYGIDYLCEVLAPSDNDTEEATGLVVSVAVRATSRTGTRLRVGVDREDADRLLTCQGPACLAGIDVVNRRVRFRFVDVSFQEELRGFLDSDRQSKSWPLDEMSGTGSAFRAALAAVSRPVVQRRLHRGRVKFALSTAFGDVSYSILEDDDGTDAVVHLPWVGRAFDASNLEPDAIRHALATGSLPALGENGLAFAKPLHLLLDQVDRGLFLHGVGAVKTEVRIKLGDRSASLPVVRRDIDDWMGFSHPVGLLFMVSGAREHHGKMVHHLDLSVHRVDGFSLGRSSRARDFLRLMRPGASLQFGTRTSWMGLSDFGEDGERLGAAVEAFEGVSEALELPLDGAFLDDVSKRDLAVSLTVLEALVVQRHPLGAVYGGFAFAAQVARPEEAQLTSVRVAEVPVVLRFSGRDVIVWCEVDVQGILGKEGLIAGVRFGAQHAVRSEVSEEAPYASVPGIFVFRDWPALPFPSDEYDPRKGTLVRFDDPLPIAARFLDEEGEE